LGDRKGIWPVKVGCEFVGDNDLTGALQFLLFQLSTTTSVTLSSNGDILVPANPGPPGKVVVRTETEKPRQLPVNRQRFLPTGVSSPGNMAYSDA